MEMKFVISLGCRTTQLKRRNPNNPKPPSTFSRCFLILYALQKTKYRFYSTIVLLYYCSTLKLYEIKGNEYVTDREY